MSERERKRERQRQRERKRGRQNTSAPLVYHQSNQALDTRVGSCYDNSGGTRSVALMSKQPGPGALGCLFTTAQPQLNQLTSPSSSSSSTLSKQPALEPPSQPPQTWAPTAEDLLDLSHRKDELEMTGPCVTLKTSSCSQQPQPWPSLSLSLSLSRALSRSLSLSLINI